MNSHNIYYEQTRTNRTVASFKVMWKFRYRTFFTKPADLKWEDACEWETKQDLKFIHFESVQLTKLQALVRGVLTRRAFFKTLTCEMQELLELQDPDFKGQYDLLDGLCNRVYASYQKGGK